MGNTKNMLDFYIFIPTQNKTNIFEKTIDTAEREASKQSKEKVLEYTKGKYPDKFLNYGFVGVVDKWDEGKKYYLIKFMYEI